MKAQFIIPMLLLTASCTAQQNEPATILELADPTILLDGDTYYIYGTSSDYGFVVYSSSDLKHWHKCGANAGLALRQGDAYGTQGFWAPQVVKMQDGRFAMFYTANEHIAVAYADSPQGPFRNPSLQDIPTDLRRIDPFYFQDSDGSKYLFQVRLDKGNKIFAQSISDDFRNTPSSTLQLAINATEDWENTDHSTWPVTEGPTVMKKNGTYYLFYSANDFRNPDYAVSYATATNIHGPWTKHGSPIIDRNILPKYKGTGHGDIFTDRDGKLRYVFHAHASDTVVSPRRTLIVDLRQAPGGQFEIDPASVIEPVVTE